MMLKDTPLALSAYGITALKGFAKRVHFPN